MATLKLKNVDKIYDNDVQAVFDFNLEVSDKEFIVFVGPSGCGKSTTLRMIAGLEEISNGEFHIDDQLMNDVAPKDRDIAMVFQSYALYPHMTVYDNMAVGLKLRKVSKEEIDEKVKNAAAILGLSEYLDRKPKALSGGQRQRVALGRAIVRNPKVFLMDEPLSNLDAKLRVAMRSEIIKLHKELQATTIYVTHDQTEAMTMADRIVVMKDGYIQQIGTPKDIYDNPTNVFVAGFTGSPSMNFLRGTLSGDKFICGEEQFEIPQGKLAAITEYENKEIILGIRPENIHIEGIFFETYPNSTTTLNVEVAELLGHETIVYAKINNQHVAAKFNSRVDAEIGSSLKAVLDMNKVHFFDIETEKSLI